MAAQGAQARIPAPTDVVEPGPRVVERPGHGLVAVLPARAPRGDQPAAASTPRCLDTAWRVTGRSPASSVAVTGPADIEIQVREMVELRERMTGVLAEATKDRATIVADNDRDKVVRGDDAVEYGLVDQVLHKVTPRSVLAEAS